MRSFRRLFVAFSAVLAVAGCTFTGGRDLVDPLARDFTWFSYLNAGDMRRACRPGAADRFRLVLNAFYWEHVRTYDILAAPGGGEALIRVFGDDVGGLSQVTPDDPLALWRGAVQRRAVPPEQLGALADALTRDGALSPPPIGMALDSNDLYWAVSLCRDGAFHFHAWLGGRAGPALSFPAVLRAIDGTGVPWPDPGLLALPRLEAMDGDRARDKGFSITVTAAGIAGNAPGVRW